MRRPSSLFSGFVRSFPLALVPRMLTNDAFITGNTANLSATPYPSVDPETVLRGQAAIPVFVDGLELKVSGIEH